MTIHNTHKMKEDEFVKFMNRVNKLRESGMNISEIARYFDIHRNTVRDRIKKFESMVVK